MAPIRVASLLLLGASLVAGSVIEERQTSCPKVHVFGARETTAPPGYGTAGAVVNSILSAYAGSTAEVINYPACGGQSSCGGVSYANSVVQGVSAVASQVNSFNQKCPSTFLVIVGYSQGGQIMDDAYCGGGDTNEGLYDTSIPISTAAQAKITAAIFMGDPRHIPGLSYNVGTCQASGFAPRPAGFKCPYANNIQSYCDAADPYCCNGSDANTHQGYANKYGSVALTFVKNKLDALLNGSTPTSTTAPPPSTTAPPASTQTKYGQCGGTGWTGPTACASGSTCTAVNSPWYYQCL